MNSEKINQIIDQIGQQFKSVGFQGLEDGLETAADFFGSLSSGCQFLSSRKNLEGVLASVAPDEELNCIAAFSNLQQLIGSGLQMFTDKMSKTFPAQSAGRPRSLSASQEVEVREYVLKLYGQGVALRLAKQRAAQKFGVSLTTVERIWADRKKQERGPSISELINLLTAE